MNVTGYRRSRYGVQYCQRLKCRFIPHCVSQGRKALPSLKLSQLAEIGCEVMPGFKDRFGVECSTVDVRCNWFVERLFEVPDGKSKPAFTIQPASGAQLPHLRK